MASLSARTTFAYYASTVKQYSTFSFDRFVITPKTGTIDLTYRLDSEITFTERVVIPPECITNPHAAALDTLLHMLHLIGGISYYKTCLPRTIVLHTEALSHEQASFWNRVYESGLGEFFFRNKIDPTGIIRFPDGAPLPPTNTIRYSLPATRSPLLVPFGGGKDSIVTAELLRKAGHKVTLFRVGKHPVIDTLAKEMNLPLITIDRKLDAGLFELNAQGALNGHVPITAYISILSLIVAELTGHRAVVFSNERSASEGNTTMNALEVNHQWSKSMELEKSLREYVKKWTGSSVEYFSLLRPLSELKIVQLFCSLSDPDSRSRSSHSYFPLFTSCNKNWKIAGDSEMKGKLWCGSCPKCAFAFALFSAFLDEHTLIESIFHKNLFDDPALLPLYRELLGIEGFKPFECVGTANETKAAFLLAHKRGDLEKTAAMQMFVKDMLPSIGDPEHLVEEELTLSDEHCVPECYALPAIR